MKTLVTGGSGFIGRRLVGELRRRGDEVVVLCRHAFDRPGDDVTGTTMVTGDILDPGSLDRAMEGCSRVYHLAGYAKNWAKDPATFGRVNVDGLLNVVRGAIRAGAGRVVWTSSAVTAGPSDGSPVSEATVRRRPFLTEYERSKFVAEQRVREFLGRGTDIIAVNPSRVFGPGLLSEGNSVTRMIAMYMSGKFRFMPGDGSAVGNYAFVEDVVRGMILAMESGRSGERYMLGGENRSYREFFDTVAEVSGRRRRVFGLPAALAMRVARFEELRSGFGHHPLITTGWMRTFLADWAVSVEKSRGELGYRPTPFREAVARTVRWITDPEPAGGTA